ncbi:metallophosphoesterase family protein [Paenibacillus eucommiae]|nr:metallophosphoesterase [Paenibacillus eucommiae]
MIYVTGDLHGYTEISKFNFKRFPQSRKLTKEDYVIVAGDFGLIWDNKNDELYWRKWLSNKKFTTLFIDGNHENFNLLDDYPVQTWSGGKVHKINESIIHLMRGQVYIINDIKLFTFGGASSHDKEFRKENINWWSREMPSNEEYEEGHLNLNKHDWKVDIVITHTCPSSTLGLIKQGDTESMHSDQLTDYFEEIKTKLEYSHWYFGHFHLDFKVSDKQTLLFNKIEEIF